VAPAAVRVLGTVCGVAPDGSLVDVPSARQRRLLGLLAVHAPRPSRAETARLTEIHAATVDDYVDGLLAARRDTEAIAALEVHIGRHPYRHRDRGLLIRALALSGRRADALRAFPDYRSLLIEEFGTEPSPEVLRIERRVATGWGGVDDDREDPAPTGELTIPVPADLAHPVAFVGRSAEQEVLRSQLARVTESGLRTVVLSGGAGMG